MHPAIHPLRIRTRIGDPRTPHNHRPYSVGRKGRRPDGLGVSAPGTASDVSLRGHVSKPADLTGVLDEGFRVAKKIFPPLLPIVLLATVPALTALGFGYGTLDAGPAVDIDVTSYVRTLAASVIGFLAFQGVGEPLSLALIYGAAIATIEGRSWSVGSVIRDTLKRFGAVFVVGALYYGAVYGFLALAVVGGVAIGAAGFVGANGQLTEALVMFALGFAVCVGATGAALWFALRYGFCLPAVVATPRAAAMESFGRSARLVAGAYVSVGLLVLLLAAIRTGVVMIAAALVPSPNIRSLELDEVFALLPALVRTQLIQQSVSVVVSAVFAIYAGATWVTLFERRRAEVDDGQSNGTSAIPTAS